MNSNKMITFSELGKEYRGNLGNQLFQIASTIGIANKNGLEYFFPEWHYSKYFQTQLPVGRKDESFKIIKEEKYSFYERILSQGNYDIDGWLQSEKYFEQSNIKEIYKFKKEFVEKLRSDCKLLFSKKTILISVRRGDFVNNPYFFQLSYKYYLSAIIKNFPDWEDRNLVFTSDDISYCRFHFSFLNNAIFLENLSAIEQLALAPEFDDYVISNSTFSWWLAWLGENKHTKIIRPIKNFRGEYGKRNDDSDFFPSRWISLDENSYQLENKYILLAIRGNFYSYLSNIKYRFKKLKKQTKNLVKKVLVNLNFR